MAKNREPVELMLSGDFEEEQIEERSLAEVRDCFSSEYCVIM